MTSLQEALDHCRTVGCREGLISTLMAADETFSKRAPFESDVWDVIDYEDRPMNLRTKKLKFSQFANQELKVFAKLFTLYRFDQNPCSAVHYYNQLRALLDLDTAVPWLTFSKITNVMFQQAGNHINMTYGYNTAVNRGSTLQRFSDWFNEEFGLPISYLYSKKKKGNTLEKDAKNKEPSTELIFKLIALNQRDNLSAEDRLFGALLVVMLATGLRIHEALTMCKDCLIVRDGTLYIHFYIGKKGRILSKTRPVRSALVTGVREAVATVTEMTDEGRALALQAKEERYPDWLAVIEDEQAARYFIRKACHIWTANPDNNLKNPAGVWMEKRKCFVDFDALLARHDGNKTKAAAEIGIHKPCIYRYLPDQQAISEGRVPDRFLVPGQTRFSDTRVISGEGIMQKNGFKLDSYNPKYAAVWPILKETVKEAREYQLKGCIYPGPERNDALEERFLKNPKRPKRASGLPEPENTLFVIPVSLLSTKRKTSNKRYTFIRKGAFLKWLEAKCTELDATDFFSSLGGNSKITSLQIRHWCVTQDKRGGMSEPLSAALYDKQPGGNIPYDDREPAERAREIRKLMGGGDVVGHIASACSELGSEQATNEYLEATLRKVMPLPYGICTHNWDAWPCPYHMNCFAARGGPRMCEHLIVNTSDEGQVKNLVTHLKDNEVFMEQLSEGDLQYENARMVAANIRLLLTTVNRGI